ncbi:MAG TPA: fibronectin type III domain-containing protein [Ornithinibacter sp.]|nr:fibronectin type III domain-containing protein [Ornithinibacter sp.]
MRLVRSVVPVVLAAVVAVVVAAVGATPATAARPALATPQLTSAVVVDTRTVTLSWTPVKGADHYVLEWAPAMHLYTSATSVTVTDLYPGDDVSFSVRAETRRNAPSGTSTPVVVSLAPEGPSISNAYPWDAETIRIFWGSGIGCVTYDLATVEGGAYTVVDPAPYSPQSQDRWVAQASGTTVSYAVRCASSSGMPSSWSASVPVTMP